MKFKISVSVVIGVLKGIGGEISGNLNSKQSCIKQIGEVENKVLGWANWIGVHRSQVAPTKDTILKLVTGWDLCEIKEDQILSEKTIDDDQFLKNTGDQTSLF